MRLCLSEILKFKEYVWIRFMINVHVSTDVWRSSSITGLCRTKLCGRSNWLPGL